MLTPTERYRLTMAYNLWEAGEVSHEWLQQVTGMSAAQAYATLTHTA